MALVEGVAVIADCRATEQWLAHVDVPQVVAGGVWRSCRRCLGAVNITSMWCAVSAPSSRLETFAVHLVCHTAAVCAIGNISMLQRITGCGWSARMCLVDDFRVIYV